jgi:hypothetical protein
LSSCDGPKRRFAAPAGKTTRAAPNSRREVDSTESISQGNIRSERRRLSVRIPPWRRDMRQVARCGALDASEKASSRKPRLPVAMQASCDGGRFAGRCDMAARRAPVTLRLSFSAPHTRRCRYCLMWLRQEPGQLLVTPSVSRVLPQLRHRAAPPSARLVAIISDINRTKIEVMRLIPIGVREPLGWTGVVVASHPSTREITSPRSGAGERR